MNRLCIDIIGAGIGGLTTAIALERKGFKVRIFEQSEVLKHIGTGIILANNAMQIYEAFGLREKIERKGNILSSMNITTSDLNVISSMDLLSFKTLYGVNTVAIHRGDLQDILLGALVDVEIKLGHKLKNIKPNGLDNTLEFENGISEQSAKLIAADGLNSIVRKILFPKNTLRNAKQICWRGVTKYRLPLEYKDKLCEAWGSSARFGFVQISETKVYWYALKSFKECSQALELDNINEYFSGFHPLVKKLLTDSPKNSIHSSEIIDLNSISSWHKNNICLLGDAAHAMTPNMGQGACQAIEDAYVLADCLSSVSLEEAFSKYQNIRFSKVNKISEYSWMIGKISHVQNPFLIKLRNWIFSMTPKFISHNQSKEIFTLQIPLVNKSKGFK